MQILIVKSAALGDVLRTTSLLRPLRRRYPGCSISWMTSREARPLLENNPYVDAIFEIPEDRRLPAKNAFDLVLSMEENVAAARWAGRLCRGTLIGVMENRGYLEYTESSAPYYGMSLLRPKAEGGLRAANKLKAANRSSYSDLWLKILGLTGRNGRREPPVLRLSRAEREWGKKAIRRLAGRRPIALNTGAGGRWPAKQLSINRTAELADCLSRLGRPLLLLGGRQEAARNRRILDAARAPLLDAGTGHGLRRFASLIGACAALVTADTLAYHIASALRVPAVVFTGPTSAPELGTFENVAKLAPRPPCACFYRPHCRFKRSCLDRIPLGRFSAALRRCLH